MQPFIFIGLCRSIIAAGIVAVSCLACSNDSEGNGAGNGGAGGAAGDGGGTAVDCSALPMSAIEPEIVREGLTISEDLAFDGRGSLVARMGGDIVRLTPSGDLTIFAPAGGATAGTRFREGGGLVMAGFLTGNATELSADGTVTPFLDGLSQPNGVYGDFGGAVYITETGGGRITRVQTDGTRDAVVTSATQPNGIVVDRDRDLIFYTEGGGRVQAVPRDATEGTPTLVTTVADTRLDGMTLDACGNIYVVDTGGGALYRIDLDAAGAAVGQPVLLASFAQSVANAQFGSGPGFDPTMLYVVGLGGVLYRLNAGVPGVPGVSPAAE